ncbi:hypothetical protein QZH41_002638 [Actinostola sp. cb2023]|nr:hypothetical protein QZH41_002638 [Actinostola sp. cb2023]
MGRSTTHNELRQCGYWILGASAAVSNVISQCVTCRRQRRPLEQQKMSSLPKDRVEQVPPFSFCVVDYFGPFVIKERRSELKRRFLARRGPVRQIRCDQGTNFVGARNELKAALTEMDEIRVSEYLLEQGFAAIDGDIFATLTRTEIGDMFMTMKEKRSAITAWSKITGMGSLEVKIQNRLKKLQRNKTQKDTESEKAKTTGKPKKQQKKNWMAVPTAEESEEEIANAIQEIKQEWKKTRKEHGKIKELMDKTYAKRRELVLIEVQPLQEVLKMFPPLQNMLYIKADLGRVLGNSDLANEMKHNFKDIWSSRLLAYTKQDKKHQKVFEEMSAAIDSGCEEEECNERAALKLASIILKPPNKRGGQRKDYEEAVMKIIPDQHSLDDQIKAVIQPAIIITQDIYNSDILYVVAEGMVLSTITTKKIADAIVV